MQKITPHLWFDDKAEEAVKFYTSIFKNSRILHTAYYGEAGSKASGREKGSVMTILFELNGQEFMALNGGPVFKFTPAISFIVYCDTQDEVDHYWEKLSKDGDKGQCGWVKDKYKVSWQIVPTVLGKMMQDSNTKKSDKVMEELLKMERIDIKALEKAYGKKEKTKKVKEEKVPTKHPLGKKGPNIGKKKYEIIKEAILSALKNKELTHTELFNEINKNLKGKFEGDINWYGETVKLDLEAKKVIERTNSKPQKYHIK